MNIGVVGAGYLGIVTAAGFGSLGNNVTVVDIDGKKIEALKKGQSPFYEPGLAELIAKAGDNISATADYSGIRDAECIFITVGTPSKEDGSIDLTYVKSAATSIASTLNGKKEPTVVIVKSTVVPGTTEEVVKPLFGTTSNVSVAMCPEFLRQGNALDDFMSPDRIVIGTADEHSKNILKDLHKTFTCPIVETNIKTAEMIKYAANTFLAAKISLINEIGNISKLHGIDVYKVAEGIGHDKRIGKGFLRSGIGFGGSCFPKDVKAITKHAESLGYEPKMIKTILQVNDNQPLRLVEGLKDKEVALLGLAFKSGTDDVRESPSIKVINHLLSEGVQVHAYDPKAVSNMRKIFPNLDYYNSAEEAISKANTVLIATEWPEFSKINFGDKLVIDGRNIFKGNRPKNYRGVCW